MKEENVSSEEEGLDEHLQHFPLFAWLICAKKKKKKKFAICEIIKRTHKWVNEHKTYELRHQHTKDRRVVMYSQLIFSSSVYWNIKRLFNSHLNEATTSNSLSIFFMYPPEWYIAMSFHFSIFLSTSLTHRRLRFMFEYIPVYFTRCRLMCLCCSSAWFIMSKQFTSLVIQFTENILTAPFSRALPTLNHVW